MKKMKYSLSILLFLIGFFLNIERLDIGPQEDVINIQSFVYGLTILAVLTTFLFYSRWNFSVIIFLGGWIVLYLLGKVVVFPTRPLIGGINTYLTITELAMMSLILVVACRVSTDLHDLGETVANVTLGDVSERVKRFDKAQNDIKTEFVRSRRYKSPLSVMVLEVQSEAPEINIKDTAEEILQMMVKKYTSNKLIRFLDRELRRTDLVLDLERDEQIILLLPETDFKESDVLARRISSKISEQLGLDINCGLASFPDQALTFEALVEQAKHQFSKNTNFISTPGTEEIEDEATESSYS